MNRDSLIGLGITGVAFISIGVVIGGVIVNTVNNKKSNEAADLWKCTAEFLKDQLLKQLEKNDRLKKELESKEA